jgi:hypothetical protein
MGGPPKSPPKGRRRGLPGWIPIALIGFLILGGIALIGIGFLTDAGEQETAQPEQAQETPREGPAGQPAGEQQPQPAEPAEEQQPAPAPAGSDSRTFSNRFELGVPTGWESGTRDGGTLLTAPRGQAEVLVLFGTQQPPERLGPVAAEVLRNQYPGARLGGPTPTRLGGQRALRVNGSYRGGEVSAIAVNAGGSSFVLTKQVARRASEQVSAQAEAVLQSFRAV